MNNFNQETKFWKRFVFLCAEINTAPNAVCKELGFSKATATHWKLDRSIPNDLSKKALAKYFNVSVEYLMGETEERAPKPSDQPKLSEGEKKLLELFRRVPLENQDAVLQMLENQDAVLQMIEAALKIK